MFEFFKSGTCVTLKFKLPVTPGHKNSNMEDLFSRSKLLIVQRWITKVMRDPKGSANRGHFYARLKQALTQATLLAILRP